MIPTTLNSDAIDHGMNYDAIKKLRVSVGGANCGCQTNVVYWFDQTGAAVTKHLTHLGVPVEAIATSKRPVCGLVTATRHTTLGMLQLAHATRRQGCS